MAEQPGRTTPVHMAIIGAGPAGCAAAVTFRQRGHRVTIIEKKRFPRMKVCGEFVSPAATEILESLLSPELLRCAGAQRVDEFFVELDGREANWRMPGAAWVLSRRALDDLLLARAREAGAEVLQPVSVREVSYADDGVAIHLADGQTVSADVVMHADGAGRHDPAGATPHRKGVIGQKCHLRAPADHAIRGIRMRIAPGAYIGTVGVEHGEATCALVARTTVVAHFGGDADSMVRALWPGFDPAWRTSDWLSCPVPGSGYVRPGHARSFRIGNAAAAVEPVGGEGIGLALWAGVTLGAMLDVGNLRTSQERFGRMYARRVRWRRPACRLAAEVLMRPRVCSALWPLLRAPALTIRPWYMLSGKPV